MTNMDRNEHGPLLPQPLRDALGQNGKAMEFYSALTPAEQRRICREVRRNPRPEAVSALVNGLVGWEEGHPPYQL